MTANEPVAGVPRLCARRADCTRPRGHDDECGPDRDQARREAAVVSTSGFGPSTVEQILEQRDEAAARVADLRAEVERLRADLQRVQRDALQGHLTTHARNVVRLSSEMERSEDAEARAESAEAEVERLRGFSTHRQAALNARLDSTEKIARDVMAERDALQRQVDAVRAHLRDHGGSGYVTVHGILAALDAVEPADQPHPTPEAGA